MSRILVIEDTARARETIEEILTLNNFEVKTARDGLEGLEIAREYLPDLIICDVMMPELDGFEVLRELHNDSVTATIPFIFLTARSDKMDVRKGMELGADDYLTKPFKEHELLSAVNIRLEKHAALNARQMRTLSSNFLNQREDEQRKLALKLQSDVTQPLAGLKLSLHGAERLSAQRLALKVAEVQQLLDQILTTTTDVVNDVWPVILDELGLLPSLLQLCAQIQADTSLTVNLKHRGLETVTSRPLKITAYRIFEEALNNVAHYAQVSEVNAAVWTEEDILNIHIEDQGVGFELDKLFESGNASGLISLRERVATLGGELAILTNPGAGVQIIAKLPQTTSNSIHTPVVEVNPAVNDYPLTTLSNSRSASNLRPNVEKPISRNAVRIAIAEENNIVREGLKRLLDHNQEMEVVAEAVHRDEVLRMVQEVRPTVLILGITMSGISNLDLLLTTRKIVPELQVLIFSSQANETYVYEAKRKGAAGYMLSNINADELVKAIRIISQGDDYWQIPLSDEMIKFHFQAYEPGTPESDRLAGLTSREREVLVRIAEGQSSKQIAASLSISPRTAETHRTNIAKKLGLRTQAEIIRYSVKLGVIKGV